MNKKPSSMRINSKKKGKNSKGDLSANSRSRSPEKA